MGKLQDSITQTAPSGRYHILIEMNDDDIYAHSLRANSICCMKNNRKMLDDAGKDTWVVPKLFLGYMPSR